MTAARVESISGYWYGDEHATTSVDVLNALRRYRSAEVAMRRRTRSSMGMGETDLLALRYLLEAARRGDVVTPKDLATRLDISSASTTVLIDRLVKSGHVRRDPHPTDRRSIIVVATPSSDDEVRHTLGRMHERMVEVAESLTPAQSDAVVLFLTRMREAVETVDAD
ncbi:MarR family winged helix-turn-helix transcriptional regulator [Schumannella sp. 10F1B-5-1]|uniref:MarR family winged helix-turn-helix transcriptional regulator n=1 Tax=Schumannella sp. 10F1B-5-1 TaxID=2590780 RepID=UPI0011327057|nr:MarR family transcriptional regulator [Schumannella sp. 10F1B-5-1]TPW72913.1 MarR family transcriptional regulator [Schumannella sp. 10F1B-5-1]